ncbi:hypothetical protein OG900_37505 [Streptomyces sp. NBC_00433]
MRCTVIITVGNSLRPAGRNAAADSPHYVVVSDRPTGVPGSTDLTSAAATVSAVSGAVAAATSA